MSALIKLGAGAAVQALPLRGAARAAPLAEVDPRDSEIARLDAEVGRLTAALAEAGADARHAIAEAREGGRLAGFAEAVDREEQRLAALREGLAAAGEAFGVQLALLDRLAPQLARAALEKLFAPADGWSAMTEAMIARQLQTLRRNALVAIRVSPGDFADPAALAGLDAGDLPVTLDPQLAPGAARIECRLGQIDLDVREQWAALAALLDEMAA